MSTQGPILQSNMEPVIHTRCLPGKCVYLPSNQHPRVEREGAVEGHSSNDIANVFPRLSTFISSSSSSYHHHHPVFLSTEREHHILPSTRQRRTGQAVRKPLPSTLQEEGECDHGHSVTLCHPLHCHPRDMSTLSKSDVKDKVSKISLCYLKLLLAIMHEHGTSKHFIHLKPS